MTTKGRLSLEDESLKKTLETTQSVTVIADAHAVATFVLANFILCVCVCCCWTIVAVLVQLAFRS